MSLLRKENSHLYVFALITLLLVCTAVIYNLKTGNHNPAVQLIRKGDYKSAAQLLVTSKKKEDQVLYNYAHARMSYTEGNLEMADFYLSPIDENYTGPLSEDIKKFKDEVKKALLKHAFELLDKQEYNKATQLLFGLSLKDKTLEPLYNFGECVKSYYSGDYKMAKFYAETLKDYSGYEADKVVAFRDKVLKEVTPEKIREQETREAKARKSQGVKIGMTQEEVLQSAWGKPKRINKTITTYGVREQWVYDGGYLYFENGILVGIQVRQ